MIDIKFAGINFTEEELQSIQSCEFEIIDIHKYLLFLKLEKQAKKIQFLKLSDEITIDLLKPKTITMVEILEYESTDQQKVLKRQEAFRKIHTLALNARRAAFGGYDGKKAKLKDTLLSSKKTELLEYFGRLFTIKEVYAILKVDSSMKSISEVVLTDFYRSNIDEIKRLQEKHKQDYTHLRLTAKTSRLEELTYLYGKLKRKYEISNNREDHKALLSTMESIRKEVEGDKVTLQGNIGIQVQHEVNLHVRAELMKGVALKEVILSRLAARSGINPLKILNSLNDSYYAKWNRLLNNTIDVEHEEVSFPSLQSYDFDMIKKVNSDKEKQDKIDLEKEKAKKIEENSAESDKDRIKNILLQKLKQNSNNINNQINNFDRRGL